MLCVLCAVAACASGGSEAAERRADTTGRRDSIAAVAASSMNEHDVIGLLALTHGADSALGTLGASKGTASDVKEFGRMIVREHHALRKDILDLGDQLGTAAETPRVAPDEAPADVLQTLESSPAGEQWDREYVDYAIAVHNAALENTARALAATHHAEVRQFIDKSVPILQKHIDKARSLRKSLPRAQDTVKANAAPTRK
jgi:putative membrane protein